MNSGIHASTILCIGGGNCGALSHGVNAPSGKKVFAARVDILQRLEEKLKELKDLFSLWIVFNWRPAT